MTCQLGPETEDCIELFFFGKSRSLGSGMLWAVSICESTWHHWQLFTCTILKATLSSWEFVTTLDFEWSVIRGRRPYLWTIWVCNASDTSSQSWLLGGQRQRADFLLR
jgi:hypothetical protein